MKKIYLTLVALIATQFSMFAQSPWMMQNVGYNYNSSYPFDIDAVDSNVVWNCAYVGDGSGISSQEFSMTTDGGMNWTAGLVTADTNFRFAGISAIDQNICFAAMYNNTLGGGGVFKTTDMGGTWTQMGASTIFTDPASFPDVIYFTDSLNGWTMGDPVGGYFEIHTTTDGGATWTRLPQANIAAPVAGEYGIVNDYTVLGNKIWFGTNKGRVYISYNGGANWIARSVVSNVNTVNSLAFRDTLNGVCTKSTTAGVNTMYKTTDGGLTWTAITPVGPAFYSDLAYVPGTSVLFSCAASSTGRGSSYSLNDGANWVLVDTNGIGTSDGYTSMDWVSPTTGWAGGFSADPLTDGIYKYTGSAVGINQIVKNNIVSAYPNPTNGLARINTSSEGTVIVKVYDILGNMVSSFETYSTKAGLSIDLRKYNAGIYSVQITDMNQQTSIVKIVRN
ncbi:MAG: T9SS type A sorting domain-containing protein [Bacteroidota bacterium]